MVHGVRLENDSLHVRLENDSLHVAWNQKKAAQGKCCKLPPTPSRVHTQLLLAYPAGSSLPAGVVAFPISWTRNLVVNGVLASVFSTLAKHLETLPFLVLDSLFPDIFEWAPVKAALYSV